MGATPLAPFLKRQRLWVPGSPAAPRDDSGGAGTGFPLPFPGRLSPFPGRRRRSGNQGPPARPPGSRIGGPLARPLSGKGESAALAREKGRAPRALRHGGRGRRRSVGRPRAGEAEEADPVRLDLLEPEPDLVGDEDERAQPDPRPPALREGDQHLREREALADRVLRPEHDVGDRGPRRRGAFRGRMLYEGCQPETWSLHVEG